MPVVLNPSDEFFVPLNSLDIGGTKVYLGMVHETDGVVGFRRRFEMARRHLREFGVAGVCGYARLDPAHLPQVLHAHTAAVAAL